MERFIHKENISHFKRLLAEQNVASDPVRHALLLQLLAAEVAKDNALPRPK
jgi:hypothetical protein